VTEVLPVSSSAHLALVPWLLDWSYASLDAELRKTVEATLHLGAAVALIGARRRELYGLDRRRCSVIALAQPAPVLAGLLLQGPVQERASGPRAVAAGLLAGAGASAAAELIAARRAARADEHPNAVDGLALGVAQAAALWPGISRQGATLAAARSRGLSREEAARASLQAGLPVMVGAALLTGARLSRRPPAPGTAGKLAAGALAAALATAASQRALGTRPLPPWPFVTHRAALATLTLRRARAGRAKPDR
jgi:undecaprenyl-diphosphatase